MRPLLLALAALAVAAPVASAAPGDLDTLKLVRFSDATEETPVGVVAQSTGRIMVIGDSNAGRTGAVPARNRLQIVRLHADGTIDTSYDGDGRKLVGLSSGGNIVPVGAVPDGDAFYVLARVDNQDDLPNCVKRALFDCFELRHRIAVFRFTAAGQIDTAFGGGDGVVLIAAGTEHRGGANGTDSVTETRLPVAMTVLPGGRVVIADRGLTSGQSRLTRLAPQGAGLDGAFGVNGRATLRIVPEALAPGPLGSVTVAGVHGLERLNASGVPDSTFDGDGLLTTAESFDSLLPISATGEAIAAGDDTTSFLRAPMLARRIGRFGAPVWSATANFPRLTADGNASARNTSVALLGPLVALGGSVDLDPDRPTDISRHGRLALGLVRLDGSEPTHSLITTDVAASQDESIVAMGNERDGDLVAVASVDLDARPGVIRAAAAVARYRAS
jgi:uncharacterized delta-60 repeat protein